MTMNHEEQLRLLSIFHYIVGGLAAFFACFPTIHLVMGIAIVLGVFEECSGKGPPAVIGYILILMALMLIACGWGLAICLIAAGRCLSRKKHYVFCLVIAAIGCVFMPFGTVLGVFTIIVLMRPSVKELFAATKAT
ncbi:MAG: hypothetical protein JSV82_02745 [Planctomycetota bacterium]|nr:MAG: hypothetical protein JSV82_02745 [Planctomycetota bacterium]